MAIFYMYMGLPGSGKSYIAHKNEDKHVIIDSDEVRARLLGDATDQSQNSRVFDHMFKEVCGCFERDVNCAYVATNVSMKRRINLLQQLHKKFPTVKFICYLVVTPLDVCIDRNSKRERRVPEYVITRMLRSFDPPCVSEGWDKIQVIRNYYDDGTLTLDGDEYTYRVSYANKVEEFGEQKNSHHALSLIDHCEKCGHLAYDELFKTDGSFTRDLGDVVWACYLHDYGKCMTQTYWEKDDYKEAHYPQHAEVGAYMALTMGYSLHTAQLIRFHMVPYMDEVAQKVWRTRMGEKLWEEVQLVHKYDVAAH